LLAADGMPPNKKKAKQREPIPEYSHEGLQNAMVSWTSSQAGQAWNWGGYDATPRSGAVNGPSLVTLAAMLNMFLTYAPACELHPTFLVKAFNVILQTHPTLLPPSMVKKYWATLMCERVVTVLSHLRRLYYNQVKYNEAIRKLNADQRAEIDKLLVKISRPGPTPEHIASLPGAQPRPRNRMLRPVASDISDVSVDSQGYPCVLQRLVNPDKKNEKVQLVGLKIDKALLN